jgi:hypothetical protein
MIYISITTIPKRIKNIQKSIDSLLQQTKVPDKIFINIPTKYKRFKEIIENEDIPKFNEKKIEITRCEDYGPGTKLLGSLHKIKKDSLVILADDDHSYENYMVEKFHYFYSKAPENAYSFYVHPLNNFGVGQGADGFAINSNFLNGVDKFYNEVIKNNNELFIHDDLWTSFFLFYVKKIKILSLQSHLVSRKDKKIPLIYNKHTFDEGLISSYSKDINDAVRERDKIAIKNVEYMFNKIKNVSF